MQLDQIIGIAEKNSIMNSLLSESLSPLNIKCLFELCTQAHPINQQLSLRIIQSLLQLDLPAQLYEESIKAGSKTETGGSPTKLARAISKETVLKFSDSNFLNILVSIVQSMMEKQESMDEYIDFYEKNVVHEATRTLRAILTNSEKNKDLREKFNE